MIDDDDDFDKEIAKIDQAKIDSVTSSPTKDQGESAKKNFKYLLYILHNQCIVIGII